jgi:predicted DNA-binding ribbon-helix-helix protein
MVRAKPHDPEKQAMIEKRSVTLSGHRTSLSLEQDFWQELQRIAKARNCSLAALIGKIDAERLKEKTPPNLSSALRVFVLREVKRGR